MLSDRKNFDDYPMSIEDVCAYLGFGQTYVHQLIREGRIKSHQPTGRRRFIYKKDLDAFVRGEATKGVS